MDPNHPHRCTARRSSDGERCRKPAIRGGKVCRSHGGAAKQVQRKARERFNDLIDPMINIAERMVQEALDGQLSAPDRLGLMKFIADRTGFVPGKNIEVEMPKWEGVMTHIIRSAPLEDPDLALTASPDRGEDSDLILDAELVDDRPEGAANVRRLFAPSPRPEPRRSADPPPYLA
jgi:hypothetical protein